VPSFALISPEKHGGNADLFSILIAEGKRRGGCGVFRKRRDARVRVRGQIVFHAMPSDVTAAQVFFSITKLTD
jgi:hypothetical protein